MSAGAVQSLEPATTSHFSGSPTGAEEGCEVRTNANRFALPGKGDQSPAAGED
jgi:hypothetical protein